MTLFLEWDDRTVLIGLDVALDRMQIGLNSLIHCLEVINNTDPVIRHNYQWRLVHIIPL